MGVTAREKPKGSGIWWVFINHQGQRKSKKIGDEKTTRKVAEKIKARLVLGELDVLKPKRNIPLFKEYCHLWLEAYVKPTKRVTTHQRYSGLFINYLKSSLGDMPINQIKRSDIRELLLSIKAKGLSKSSVSAAKNVISGTLEYAIDDELISYNPTLGILKKLNLDDRKDREPVSSMTPDEVALFLSICLNHEPLWYRFFLCSFRTGMRLGEVLGLHWGDINWNGKYIHVKRSFRHGRITRTKTGTTRRVDMSRQLVEELRNLQLVRKKEALKSGNNEIVDIIFHTHGGYSSQNSIRNIWKRVLKKAGLPNVKLHITRHTYASILLSNGESPVYVKEQLGHSSIQMTVDIYGHLIPSGNRKAVDALDDAAPKRTPSATFQNEKAVTY